MYFTLTKRLAIPFISSFFLQQNQMRIKKMNIFRNEKTIIGFQYQFCDKEDDYLERPYLGCSLRSMIDKPGMMILLVNSESPAWKGGLKVQDVLVEIDGHKINEINDYYQAIAANSSKKKTFKVIRNGEEKLFEINM